MTTHTDPRDYDGLLLTPARALRLLSQHGMDVIDMDDPAGDFLGWWEARSERATVSAMLLWLGY